MRVGDIMATNPATCGADATLEEVAQKMVECDCGMIPIVDGGGTPIGTVTDRDIACRAVAKGRNPLELSARDVMTTPCVTISAEADVEACARLLENNAIRRIVVTDRDGRCCGVVAQADLARKAKVGSETIAEIIREVSEPTVHASLVH